MNFTQRRDPSAKHPKEELPRDYSLKDAVERMTKAAKAEDRHALIMTQTEWKKLVLSHMKSSQINDFSQEIVNRIGKANSIEDVNRWLGLAMKYLEQHAAAGPWW